MLPGHRVLWRQNSKLSRVNVIPAVGEASTLTSRDYHSPIHEVIRPDKHHGPAIPICLNESLGIFIRGQCCLAVIYKHIHGRHQGLPRCVLHPVCHLCHAHIRLHSQDVTHGGPLLGSRQEQTMFQCSTQQACPLKTCSKYLCCVPALPWGKSMPCCRHLKTNT